MESGCKDPCEHNEYLYKFSTDTANFDLAIETCTNNGESLASDLERDVYETINKCCSFASGSNYFIGLVSNRSRCMDPVSSFHWFNSKTCSDGSPLNPIINQHNSQCVVIAMQNNNLPRAAIFNCTSSQRYVCQTKISPTVTTTFQPMEFTSNKSIKYYLNEAVSDDVALDRLLLFGIVICVVSLVISLALILFSLFDNRKLCFNKFQKSENSRKIVSAKIKTESSNQNRDNQLSDAG